MSGRRRLQLSQLVLNWREIVNINPIPTWGKGEGGGGGGLGAGIVSAFFQTSNKQTIRVNLQNVVSFSYNL